MNDRMMIAAMALEGYRTHYAGSSKKVARWSLDDADALLAAAGEQDRPITADDVKADPNLFAAMFADKRQVAGIIARAEAAEAKAALAEGILDDLKAQVARLERQLEPLTEDEAREALGQSVTVHGLDSISQTIKACEICDRIRARRSE